MGDRAHRPRAGGGIMSGRVSGLRRHLLVPAIIAALTATAAVFLLSGGAPQVAADGAAPPARIDASLGLVVQRVEIEGRENTPPEALDAAIGDPQGRAVTDIDLAAVRQRLEHISWVRRAQVARQLPDRLVIRIEERRPFALWQRQGRLHLVDREGVVLTDEDLARWRTLPLIVGDDAPGAAPTLLETLAQVPTIASEVEAAIRVAGRRWNLRLESGVLVKLPEDEQPGWGLREAVRRLAELARQERLLERSVTVIDLRLADRLVLRLPPGVRPQSAAGEQQT
ncbi:MAG: FtsQ-type POTRA domain-containing protein [Alphaproteobacteria bacterium]|nr:MAG: FtsQ-type POTRA domain-containing protein [Alphaproteobacteria bacterium]